MGKTCCQPLTCGRLAGSHPCPCFGLKRLIGEAGQTSLTPLRTQDVTGLRHGRVRVGLAVRGHSAGRSGVRHNPTCKGTFAGASGDILPGDILHPTGPDHSAPSLLGARTASCSCQLPNDEEAAARYMGRGSRGQPGMYMRQADTPLHRGASSCQQVQLQQLACWHMSREGLHLGFWRLNSAKALRTLGSTLRRQTEKRLKHC